MKGARGLLISITGGRDLTLYEVDEAATRIREEVDQDANIIVGATFDESLDGMIRVSVVATGIDQARRNARRRLRTRRSRGLPIWRSASVADNQRIAERIERAEPARPAATAASADIRTCSDRGRAGGSAVAGRCTRQRQCIDRIGGQGGDRCGRRGRHDPSAGAETLALHRSGRERAANPRIGGCGARGFHSAAGRADADCARRACRGSTNCRCRRRMRSAPGVASCRKTTIPEKRRVSLLQRLASVGLGRREPAEEQEAPPAATRRRRRCAVARAADAVGRCRGRPSREPECRSPNTPSAPAPQGLDQHGRQSAVHNSSEEDQLDIPAFLRRQAN